MNQHAVRKAYRAKKISMKNKWTTVMACFLWGGLTIQADQAFRNHRYDGFKVLPTNGEQIVFIGNSITNMHEWCEAFGNHNVINRGTSGAVSDEVVNNLESMIAGNPKKAFIMIGTNDLGTSGINNAAHVAGNARLIIDYIQKTSPETEIYVQSILPSRLRNLQLQQETNDSLKNICRDFEVTYIDLWDKLLSVSQNNTHTLDGLHLSATGYRIWCNTIAGYVGSSCMYPEDAQNQTGGLDGSYGMRLSAFGMQKVNAEDILLIGDEVIHGGEWHELFRSAKVKNRGTGWGWPGPGIADVTREIPVILKGRSDNEEPQKIFLSVGAADINGTAALSTLKDSYDKMVQAVRELAPNTEIYIQSVLPFAASATNTSRTEPFNEMLKEIAGKYEKVTYVDTYTEMADNHAARSTYFTGNYLYGKGYVKLAQILAQYMGDDVNPVSEQEAEKIYALISARQNLADVVIESKKLRFGKEVGEIDPEKGLKLKEAVSLAEKMLSQDQNVVEELNETATQLLQLKEEAMQGINQPKVSAAGEEYWYKIYTPNRDYRYLTSNGAGNAVVGEPDRNYARAMWKFEKREKDGDYNIVNRADHSYLNPNAAYNAAVSTQKDEPEKGWSLSYSNAPGTYIITSGTVELNQTRENMNYAIYNWSSNQAGTDRTDSGCQFALSEAGEPTEEPVVDEKPMLTYTNIEMDGTAPFRIPDADAEQVMKARTLSVVIDFTSESLPVDTAFLVASSNENEENYFGVVLQERTKYGVKYIGDNGLKGWYTQNGIDFSQRKQMVITMDGETESYAYYTDGKLDRTVSGMGAYGYRVFGNVPGVTGLFLGGIVTEDHIKFAFKGTIHSIRFYNRKLSASEIAALEYENQEKPEQGDSITVSMGYGKFVSGNGNWNKTWQSTSDSPLLIFDSGYNNMTSSGDNIVGYVGLYSPQNYTLSVPAGYIIEGYTFDFCIHNNGTPITLTVDGKTYTSKTEDQSVAVSGLDKSVATFTLSGANKGIIFKNFRVHVIKDNRPQEPRVEIFTTAAGASIPYRIPAITRMHNGDVIAVADYRHSGQDIGIVKNGRIDLHARISKDNGKTWGELFPVVEGLGANYAEAGKSDFWVAFGDPCIAADRESDRVLLMSCAGNVSFPAGTRDNHQGIAVFHSEDNGTTWAEPKDVSESIYAQFDKSQRGPVRAMFIGSGKIHQSRWTKVKDYYRLYAAVLVKDVNGVNCNYVIYSDDFGDTWKVLGDPNVPAIPSGGDEPKAEELPDGSVLISSRCSGGRYYNIFSFSDSEKALGCWGTMAFSGESNQGVTAQSNSCNGEIMIVPARRKSDQKKLYVALQSVPFGSGRSNVGIYYKELESLEDFSDPEHFAKEWDGKHQASVMNSGYSTMTLQADHTIGFLFEESTYGRDYTIIYKNYSLETITDSLYVYDEEVVADDIVKDGFEEKLNAIKECVGKNVGNIKETCASAIETAGEKYLQQPSKAAYEAFNQAVQTAEQVEIESGKYYRLRNAERQEGTLYLVLDPEGMSASLLEREDTRQLFLFQKDESSEGYRVICKDNELYIGTTPDLYAEIPVTESVTGAGVFSVSSTLKGLSTVTCNNGVNASYASIHLDASGKLVPWTMSSEASQWFVEPIEVVTDVELLSPDAQKKYPVYDLTGRRVLSLQKGIYIQGGHKFIIK